jgi:LAGLIDADG endonuclease
MKKQLTVSWLMGMIDGDGYFGLERVTKKRKGKISIFYRPIFALGQKDPAILYKIKEFLGCGSVSAKGKQRDQYHYRIRTTDLFLSHLVPLFQGRSFQTYKQLQFDILIQALNVLRVGPLEGHSKDLEQLDQAMRQKRYLDYVNPNALTWDWFVGFFEAEGCLCLNIQSPKDIRLLFKVPQKNKSLLIKIQQFFGCGTIQTERPFLYTFQIASLKSIEKNILTLLEQTSFHSQKNISRVQWLKACHLVIDARQEGWSDKRYQKLLQLKTNLNKKEEIFLNS